MKFPSKYFWKDKKVFITGAQGFKGRWLVKWLNKMGCIIATLDDSRVEYKEPLVDIIEGFRPEIVIHMAAVSTVQEAFVDPINAVRTNAIGTLTLLEVLKGVRSVKAILNVTTDKVYHMEGLDRGYIESDILGGLEMYSVSKVCSEHISTVYQKTYGLPVATARAGNVIGGGDWKRTRIIPNYYFSRKENTILDVNINAIRPWQYVLDCLCGYLLLCENLYDNISYVGAWNFASNEYESRSVQWIVDEMNTHYETPLEYRLIDARGYYETKNLKLCSDKARKVLQWEPKYDMKETIRRTANWYKEYDTGVPLTILHNAEIDSYIGEK